MLSLLAQTAVSFVATVSFAILFQVPREQYVYSGLCGAAGWLCYLLVMQNYPSPAVASFAAVVVLTVMSRIFAVRRKTPVTVFLICGIFPLVPGAGIYYTAYNFIIGNNQMAVAKGWKPSKLPLPLRWRWCSPSRCRHRFSALQKAAREDDFSEPDLLLFTINIC